jgi:hypothetical protein
MACFTAADTGVVFGKHREAKSTKRSAGCHPSPGAVQLSMSMARTEVRMVSVNCRGEHTVSSLAPSSSLA